MSDTPRTDDNTYGGNGIIGAGYVSADFARQLERELNLMTEGRRVDNLERVEERNRLLVELQEVKARNVEMLQARDKWRAMAKELADLLQSSHMFNCSMHSEKLYCSCGFEDYFNKTLTRFNELEKSI